MSFPFVNTGFKLNLGWVFRTFLDGFSSCLRVVIYLLNGLGLTHFNIINKLIMLLKYSFFGKEFPTDFAGYTHD